MKILIITNLFPNSQEPTRGIFNKQQFAELAKLCELKVVAPIPWHRFSKAPDRETIEGIDVYHPRYFMIPKIWHSLYGIFFFISLLGKIKEISRDFKFDLIFATWAYPDGFGSFLIAKVLKKPVIIKVHGSDVNIYTKSILRKKMVSCALRNSDKVIAVSNALKQKLVAIGVPAEKIQVIPNGVDTELFKPLDQAECRKKLGLPLDKKIILYAGNFAQVKGVDILVEAFGEMVRSRVDILLLLVGDGPLETMLRSRVRELGIEGSVIFSRRTTHDSVPCYMNACDVFCLPSRSEGCPNVVLEALACGTPVVATQTGGMPEIIKNGRLGVLVDPENLIALRCGINEALARRWDRDAMRASVAGHSWTDNAKKLFELLETLVLSDKMTIGARSAFNILYHHRTQGTGAEGVHIAGIIKGLRDIGQNVYVVSPPGVDPEKTAGDSPCGKKKSTINIVLSHTVRIIPQFLFEILEVLYNVRAYRSIKAIIRKHKVDFIYERHSFFSFAATLLANKYAIPIIIEVNEVAGEKRVRKQCFTGLAKKVERYVFENAHSVMVVSDFLKSRIGEYHIDTSKILVIPNGIDPVKFQTNGGREDLRKRYGINNETTAIGFIGWFAHWHNIELLIDTFKELAKTNDVRLFLIGDGTLKNKFRGMVNNYGIQDKVIFSGPIPHSLIPDFIDMLDICVIPDSNEYRSPIKMFEYMAMGKAVVAPRLTPIEGIIRDGENGVLFNPKDKDDFERVLRSLIDNVATRERIGELARNTVLENYTWIGNAKRILEIASVTLPLRNEEVL